MKKTSSSYVIRKLQSKAMRYNAHLSERWKSKPLTIPKAHEVAEQQVVLVWMQNGRAMWGRLPVSHKAKRSVSIRSSNHATTYLPNWVENLHLHKKPALKYFLRLYLFLEWGEGKEKERERNILPLGCTPLRDRTTTQLCALTGNLMGNLSFCGTMPNPLSHTCQGCTQVLIVPQTRSNQEMPFKIWMNKQTVIPPYNTILVGNKKVWATEPWEDMEEPW